MFYCKLCICMDGYLFEKYEICFRIVIFFEFVILLMVIKLLFLKMCFMIIYVYICCKEIKILYRFYKMMNFICMCFCVLFEIESIVEIFVIYCVKVFFDFIVIF